jgi:methionyl-tRNA formyltransferase
MSKLNVLLAADLAGGAQTLRTLVNSGHRVVAVLSPLRKRMFGSISDAARKYSIPTIPGSLVKQGEFAGFIRQNRIDLVINSLSPYVICDEVLAAPRIGAFNLHPSLLPRYGGITPASWVLYNSERWHGCTLHWMTAEVDAGPIAYRSRFEIDGADTPVTLLRKAIQHGSLMLLELLAAAANDPGSIPKQPQDLSKRTYYTKANLPRNPWLSWEDPADYNLGYVRACDYWPFDLPTPWQSPRTWINGRTVEVLKMELDTGGQYPVAESGTLEPHASGLRIACGWQWLLITKLRYGGKVLSGEQLHEIAFDNTLALAAAT